MKEFLADGAVIILGCRGWRVAIHDAGTGIEMMNLVNAHHPSIHALQPCPGQPVIVRARKHGFLPFEIEVIAPAEVQVVKLPDLMV